MSSTFTFISSSAEETHNWAKKWAKELPLGSRVALKGHLGAGKTTLVKGFMEGVGYKAQVTSPSYSLVHEYETTPPVIHIDLYRLSEDADWEEIGLDYYLSQSQDSNEPNICFIEWPERTTSLDIPWTHEVQLTSEDSTKEERTIQVTEF